MRSLRFSTALFAAFVFLGAGCLGGGGSAQKATTGGLWVSQNTGADWTAMHALPGANGVGSIGTVDFLSFAVDPSDPSALYAGSQGSGLFTSLDGGATWSRPENPEVASGTVLDIAVSHTDVCTYYVLKADRLMKTTSCGRNFDTQTYVEGRTNEALTTLALDWYNANVLYLGTTAGEVLKSSDGGDTWSVVYSMKDSISALEISNADSRFVIVGGQRTGIYRSDDGGLTWISLEDTLDDMRGADRVYALAQSSDGGRLVASTKYGLLLSSDKGLTWEGISLLTAAGDVTISALAIDPRNEKNIAYGTPTALYTTADSGATWSTAELPTSRAASVLRFMADGALWLGVRSLED